MSFAQRTFGKLTARRALALLAGFALLYFAVGGAYLHEHKDGRGDTPCHVCQSLHLPALQPSSAATVSVPEFVSWYQSRPVHAAACEAFSFHHAGRAPPVV